MVHKSINSKATNPKRPHPTRAIAQDIDVKRTERRFIVQKSFLLSILGGAMGLPHNQNELSACISFESSVENAWCESFISIAVAAPKKHIIRVGNMHSKRIHDKWLASNRGRVWRCRSVIIGAVVIGWCWAGWEMEEHFFSWGDGVEWAWVVAWRRGGKVWEAIVIITNRR